jgi:hypothetical protein
VKLELSEQIETHLVVFLLDVTDGSLLVDAERLVRIFGGVERSRGMESSLSKEKPGRGKRQHSRFLGQTDRS